MNKLAKFSWLAIVYILNDTGDLFFFLLNIDLICSPNMFTRYSTHSIFMKLYTDAFNRSFKPVFLKSHFDIKTQKEIN